MWLQVKDDPSIEGIVCGLYGYASRWEAHPADLYRALAVQIAWQKLQRRFRR